MSKLKKGQTITRIVNDDVFTIKSDGNMISINGFPVTVDQWSQVLNGKQVKLTEHGKTASLTSDGKSVLFNGKSMTEGSKMSIQISFGNEKRSPSSSAIAHSLSGSNVLGSRRGKIRFFVYILSRIKFKK